MSSKKQREILRQRRIEFDKTVAENRKKEPNIAKAVFDVLSEEKAEPKNESAPKKKTTTTKKKAPQKAKKE